MDVIYFLCASLDSSTVQLHDSLGSRRSCASSKAGFSSQNGDRACSVYYRRAAFCWAFLWGKGLSAKNVNKEIFSVYGGKCFSRKAVHNWVKKFSEGHSKVADDETEVRKLLRQQSKTPLCCGFRRTGKAMGQVYRCWWRTCREINVLFFPGSNITFFYVLYPFMTYLLTLPRIYHPTIWRYIICMLKESLKR
jgi:hypothetical protein